MPNERFDIIFAGELIEGEKPEAVRENLKRRFKSSDAELKRLFSGKPVAIKKGADIETAGKYRLAFRKAGALVRIRPSSAATKGKAAKAASIPLTLLPINTGSLEEFAPKLEPGPLPDISGMGISTPGAILDETPPPPPARIDTGGLDVVKGDWSLEDCHTPPLPQAIPNIDDLEFAAPDDTSHIPPEPPAAPLPDIAALGLAAPEDESHIPPRPPAAPLPDISSMTLEEREEEQEADSAES